MFRTKKVHILGMFMYVIFTQILICQHYTISRIVATIPTDYKLFYIFECQIEHQ